MKRILAALLLALLPALPAAAQEGHEHHHAMMAAAAPNAAAPEKPAAESLDGLQIPDASLVDQDGRTVRFYTDLVKDRVVAVNFIFTTCTTICPPMGANFARLRKLLGDRAGREVHLISVSVDPATDTPERLKAWSQKFGAGPGWTLLTGDRDEVVRLLKALGAFTPDISDHSPLVLLGNDARHQWTRASGLAAPARLAELIDGMTPPPATAQSPARNYFGDIRLVNQDGQEMRLYSDLIQNKTVVIDVMFTACTGACPIMSSTFARLQDRLGERLGKDVHLISISVDPVNDTPARLKEFAARFKARPGWFFLTGPRENVETALRKLGQYVENPEAHQALFLIGNDRTGLWKKAFGLAKPEEIFPVVDSVVNDQGADQQAMR